MAKTASDKPSAPAEEELKRKKKQARQEAKLMLEIEEAKKDLKKAQKKQSKAQARLEARSTSLHTLEAHLAEVRAQNLEPEIAAPPQSAEPEPQQELSELESSIVSSNGRQLASPEQEDQGEITTLTGQATALPQVESGIGTASASPETGTSTSTDEEQKPPFVEEVMARSGEEVVQDNETATETEPAPTATTPGRTPAQKTAAARKPAATKRPASQSTTTKRPPGQSTTTKRPASRSQSTRKPPTATENKGL